jgi:pimeloyl-ACP methyl ester carboxylesterase
MEFKEFGEQDKPVILLIHGFCMPWNVWQPQIGAFSKEYHVIVPALEGHEDQNQTTFTSVENNSNQILDYLEKHNYKEIFAICGLSLGGAVTVHILALNRLVIQKAIIDAGITPLHASKIKEAWIVYRDLFRTCLARKNKKILELAFSPKDYSQSSVDGMYKILQHISNTTVKNVFYSVDTYQLPKDFSSVQTEIRYWYGTKEEKEIKRDAEFVTNAFPNAKIRVFQGLGHGQLCLGNPDLYLKYAFDFFSEP